MGLGCLFVAWQLWNLKRKLSHTADTLVSVEHAVHRVLYPAPGYIRKGQSGTHNLRQRLQRLEPQLQRVQQVMGLLGVGQFLWRRGGIGLRMRRKRKGTR